MLSKSATGLYEWMVASDAEEVWKAATLSERSKWLQLCKAHENFYTQHGNDQNALIVSALADIIAANEDDVTLTKVNENKILHQVLDALVVAEASLSDIGDADREPGDDVAWCEKRAHQALELPRKAIIALKEVIAQPAQFDPVMRPLQWSEERLPCEVIRYNHIVAKSCLGLISIEWKGWKEYDDCSVYVDGNYLNTAVDLESAKVIVDNYLKGLVLRLIDDPVSKEQQQHE